MSDPVFKIKLGARQDDNNNCKPAFVLKIKKFSEFDTVGNIWDNVSNNSSIIYVSL